MKNPTGVGEEGCRRVEKHLKVIISILAKLFQKQVWR